jgi:hypothetical protein
MPTSPRYYRNLLKPGRNPAIHPDTGNFGIFIGSGDANAWRRHKAILGLSNINGDAAYVSLQRFSLQREPPG